MWTWLTRARAVELALDQLRVEIQEMELMGVKPMVEHVVEQTTQGLPSDWPSTEAGDHVVQGDRKPGQRQPGVLTHDAAGSDRKGLLDDDNSLGMCQRIADLGGRPRPEA